LVQERALLFAETHDVRFAIAAPGLSAMTVVGPGPDVREPAPVPRKLRVALFGHGTVGSGLYRRLVELPEHFEIVGIAVRDLRKAEAAGVPAALLDSRVSRALQRPADVVVELIGGVTRATRLIAVALGLGRHVVTANKAAIARHGPRLEDLARDRGVSLSYSASVGGALPALETLRRSAGEVRSFSGIFNATSNYVLDSIASGLAPDEAVRAAQREGYAEADPTLDLDGTDSAQKLVILARAAFGREVRVRQRGIDSLDPAHVRAAREEGLAFRLVASCGEALEAEVGPLALPLAHPLGETTGAENRLVVERHNAPPLFLSATGAGRWPTAEAVLADLFDVAAEVRP
jgi:homoserine dehydrogenase